MASGRGASSNLMREYVIVDAKQLYPIPDTMPLEEACLAEPVTLALHTIRKANIPPHKKMLIMGAGAMGQIILCVAASFPIDAIVISDPHEEKLRTVETTDKVNFQRKDFAK